MTSSQTFLPAYIAVTVYYFVSLYTTPAEGQFTLTPSWTPPTSVQSADNNHVRRFNIREGASFTITCTVQHSSGSFNADFYKDGFNGLISDGTLVNTTYTKTGTNGGSSLISLSLTFNNFQAVHNGRYQCYANTTDGNTVANSQVLYGTGPITVTLVTPQYQVYYSDESISARVEVRGEFYDVEWYYHPTDPLAGGVGQSTLFGTPGVAGEFFRQGVYVAVGTSTVHAPGYFVPEILDTQFTSRTIVADESTLYRAYAAPTASLPTLGTQSPGGDLTVTCTATGYTEVTISFTTSGISASSSTGDHVTTVTATPSTPFTTTRSMTFFSISTLDCGSVTCTASNADRTGTQTSTATANVQVLGPPTVSISPVAEQVIPTGGSVTLTCSAEDCVSGSFTYMWYRDGVSVSSSAVLNITNVSSTNYGRYECKATGSGGVGSAAKTIAREIEREAVVQLYLFTVSNCLIWAGTNTEDKLSIIQDTLQSVMTTCLRYNVTFSTGPLFSCLGMESESMVVFRAGVVYTYTTLSSVTPLSLLSSWVSNQPFIVVNQDRLQVNGACQVESPSLDTRPQCTPIGEVSPTSLPLTITIPVIVCGVLLMLSLCAIIILVVVCVKRKARRRRSFALKVSSSKDDYNEYEHTKPQCHGATESIPCSNEDSYLELLEPSASPKHIDSDPEDETPDYCIPSTMASDEQVDSEYMQNAYI